MSKKLLIKQKCYSTDAINDRSASSSCIKDNAVFQRTIDLIESSSSKHFEPTGDASDRIRARDVIQLVAHRVVHGGSRKEPMALWPGHEEGLEQLDKLSEFAPLHVRSKCAKIKLNTP